MESDVITIRPLALRDAAGAAALPGVVSPRTVDWWRKSLAVLDRFLGGDVPVAAVTRVDIERWQVDLLSRMSPVTANNYIRAVRIVYNRLLTLGAVAENPAALVAYAPQPPNRPQAVTEATYQALWREGDTRDRAILALLWGTGGRIGELPTIALPGLEFWEENETLCLAALVTGKYHRRRADRAMRYLYCDGDEAAAVRHWLLERPAVTTDALFPSRDGLAPIPVPTLHSILRKLRLRAGLGGGVVGNATVACNAHAFRHAFAYRKRREGYPLEWISEWLGHADPAFTAKMYGDKTEPEIRRRFFAAPPRGR